ncbi:TonB-dependent receptor [Phenylobacterium sp.]|uniref:TonB-dependent receptor n=1 Tax=Phenylobacterium sp. TaxID=1871053 RepID=UPI00301CA7A0
MRSHYRTMLFAGAAITVGLTPAAHAAEAASSAEAVGIEEVIVTARKRSETDISVPAVVTALSGEMLAAKGVSDVYGIAQLTPQLSINNNVGPIGGQIALRGVASGNTVGVDQTVSLNIDGVAVSNAGATRIGQFDLRQVEILKGPQTLFFGKNSPGGVISFLSQDPTATWNGYGRASYEFEAREWRAEAAISGPLTDALSMRLAGYVNSIDGYLRNPLPTNFAPGVVGPSETRSPHQDEIGGRLTVLFEPSDKLRATFKTAYVKAKGASSFLASQLVYCPTGAPQAPQAIFGPPADNCRLDKYGAAISDAPASITALIPEFGDGTPRESNSQLISSLNLSYDLTPELNLTSVTGYHRYKLDGFSTQVGPRVGIGLSQDQLKEDYSQELRLASDFGGAFDFMVGAYYQRSGFDEEPRLYLLTAPYNVANTYQRGRAGSVFGQLTWRFAENWELAGGGRYTEETKRVVITRQLQGDVTGNLAKDKVKASDLSPEVTLTYRPSTRLTVFAAYKEGFKSGGFNPSVTATVPVGYDPSFGPERVAGMEAGVKALLLDRSLRVNGAIYNYKYSDLQVSIYDGQQLSTQVRNAASARVQGAEIDFRYQPPAVSGLSIDGAVAYNRARYKDFIGTCYVGQTVAQGCNLVPAGGRFTSQDYSGEQLPNAPIWSANLGAAYVFPINGDLSFELNGGVRYKSSYNPAGDLAPGGRQKEVAFVDLGARVFAEDGSWDLALIGRNITDKLRAHSITNQSVSGTTAGLAAGTPADLLGFVNRPLEVRLQLTIRPELWR